MDPTRGGSPALHVNRWYKKLKEEAARVVFAVELFWYTGTSAE